MTRPFVSSLPAEEEAEETLEQGEEPRFNSAEPVQAGDQTLAMMPESQMAAMLGMSQYVHTQALSEPLTSFESIEEKAVGPLGSNAGGGQKRRRGGGATSLRRRVGFSFTELLERAQCSEVELRRQL